MEKAKRKKILFIERHDSFRESLTELLRLKNYHVFTATNGYLGLSLTRKYAPDLVICARSFSDCNCWNILQELRKADVFRKTPFIFLSSKPAGDEHQKMSEQEAVFTLIKPFPTEKLIDRIEACFAPTVAVVAMA